MDSIRQIRNVRAARALRMNMVLWTAAIALAIQLTMALFVLIYQRAGIVQFSDDRLKGRANSIMVPLREAHLHAADGAVQALLDDKSRFMLSDHIVAAVYGSDGRLLAASPAGRAPPFEALKAQRAGLDQPFIIRENIGRHATSNVPDGDVRMIIWRATDDRGAEFVLVCLSNDAQFESMMNLVYRVFGIAIPIGVAIAAFAGWLIGGLAVAPLVRLRKIAGSLLDDVEDTGDTPPLPSEVAELEKSLLDVRMRLRDALLVQDRFISNVSHELKTPISVLLTEAQTVDAASLPPDGRRFVQSVTDEMRRLGRMIHGFLTLTRLRGGKSLEAAYPCSINDIVMEAMEGCSPMARQYNVRLVTQLVESANPSVQGEGELLRVMVDNLIRNAIKFSPEHRDVNVRVATDDSHCAVLVRDSGPGVPEDLLDKVFHRFVQAPAEASRSRGHGLGLSIAQGIAELHGGQITVRNSPTGGCEFAARLPMTQAAPQQPRTEEPAPKPVSVP